MWSEALLGAVTSIGAFALTVLFVRWERLEPTDVGAWPDRWTAVRLPCGFAIGLVVVAVWASISAACGYVHWARGPEMQTELPLCALAAYLSLACREELAFHGYPLRNLVRPLGVWGAQLLVALMFAVEHRLGGMDWTHAICGAAVGSLLFGMSAIATRSLAIPIGLHAAWNFGHWALGFKPQPGLWTIVAQPGGEVQSETALMLIYVGVMRCATVAFWFWYKWTASGIGKVARAGDTGS
jgi:membrane protease YdiL (CAAX protease family)